ncbi:TetR/AcrR family transcriptional regulator [Actinacidiphila glaucinigra]|uniref:Transcriptional regulator, TetR family n=1 Tax=Actinacidiphila glaucinigra TaxID=235986 RepID=A0A239DQ27_9ACTN|nr:TetR/AcrR family transcriptional regulator [Actinacidiphila glaucinigra]SNS34610.1 transcriptional regulator, TetR family [Actinacidiphila glaucinigra]
MTDGTPSRRRDSARSRELLLQAAGELFSERGFDRTTIRDIGERAGVDPALIARYFGNKSALYIAVVRAEMGDTPPPDLLGADRLRSLFERRNRRSAGPVFWSAVQAHDDPAVQEAAHAQLYLRLVDPLRERFAGKGLDRPQLRAEVATAAFLGVLLARGAGTLDELAAVDLEELLPLVQETLRTLDS